MSELPDAQSNTFQSSFEPGQSDWMKLMKASGWVYSSWNQPKTLSLCSDPTSSYSPAKCAAGFPQRKGLNVRCRYLLTLERAQREDDGT